MPANVTTLFEERFLDTTELDYGFGTEVADPHCAVETMSLQAQIEARLPRHDVMLRLEVLDGEHAGYGATLYGRIEDLPDLHDEMERRRILWKRHGTFGDARLQVIERRGPFIAR